MNVVQGRMGPLDVTVVDGGGTPELLVILCHGYGAPGTDLVGVAPELLRARPELSGRVRFIFPQAPLALAHVPGGRAWWHLDVEALAMAVMEGRARDLSMDEPEGLSPARRALLALIEEATASTGLGWDRVVLGGFSQGAMLTTDVTLRAESRAAALAIFSGTLLCEPVWRARARNRAGLPVLQSHGRQDPLLPFEAAERLRTLFLEAGLPVEWIPFDGGHTIHPEALGALIGLLEAVLD